MKKNLLVFLMVLLMLLSSVIMTTEVSAGFDVTIKKEGADKPGVQLSGANLKIEKKEGENWTLVRDWTTIGTPDTLALPAGDYRLIETKAPSGYAKAKMIEFRVHEGGSVSYYNGSIWEDLPDKTIVMKDPVAYEVLLSKTGEDGMALAGAQICLSKIDGWTKSWYSGTGPDRYYLVPGEYSFLEVAAPTGYLKTDQVIKFKVDSDGSIHNWHGDKWVPLVGNTLTLANQPDPDAEYDVTISKVTEYESNKQLLGVDLRIDIKDDTDPSGWREVDRWWTAAKPRVVTLKAGNYRLAEMAKPADYAFSEKIEFRVHAGGKVSIGGAEVENATVVIVNKFRTDTEWAVKFKAVDGHTSEMLPGADLRLEKIDGTLIQNWETTDSEKSISLYPGVYKLIETNEPAGYILAEEIEFLVRPDGSMARKSEGVWYPNTNWWPAKPDTVAVQNIREKYDLDFIKIDANTNKGLAGAVLRLETSGGTLLAEGTSTENPMPVSLPWGAYKLIETAAPTGYKLATEIEFRIDAYGNVEVNDNGVWKANTGSPFNDPKRIVIRGTPIPYDIKFSKLASNRSGELKGAELRVEKSDGTLVEKWTSTGTAKIIALIAGEYKMVETKAPKGYWLAKEIVFRVNADGSVETRSGDKWVAAKGATVRMMGYSKDAPVETPKTGDTSNLMLYAGICLLAAAGLASLMLWKYLEKERAKSVESEESVENEESE